MTFAMKTRTASTAMDPSRVLVNRDSQKMSLLVLISMSALFLTLVIKTLTVSTLMDLTRVHAGQDSQEMGPSVLTSTSVTRTEALVTKTPSVLITTGPTLVFAKMVSQEMAKFAWISTSV